MSHIASRSIHSCWLTAHSSCSEYLVRRYFFSDTSFLHDVVKTVPGAIEANVIYLVSPESIGGSIGVNLQTDSLVCEIRPGTIPSTV
jgi:hypothetical protein